MWWQPWKVFHVAYAATNMSNKRHIEKNDWIITATDPTLASENQKRKTWRGPLVSVHPLSLLSQLLGKHGVNPAPSITSFQRRADKAGTRPPGQGGWKFSCPPRLLKPCAPTDRTPTAGLAIRSRPRPEGPRTAATAASPLPPTTLPTQLYKICIRRPIYIHAFASFHKMVTPYVIINITWSISEKKRKNKMLVIFLGTWFC